VVQNLKDNHLQDCELMILIAAVIVKPVSSSRTPVALSQAA